MRTPPISICWFFLLAAAAGPGLAASAGAAPPPIAADSTQAPAAAHRTLSPGSIVRLRKDAAGGGFVRGPDVIRKGLLVRATPESLWLASSAGAAATPVALADVRRIDVKIGEDRVSGALLGAGAGALCGFSAGLLIGSVIGSQTGLDRAESGLGAALFSLGGLVVGVPAGAIIGAVRGVDRWETVEESP